MSFDFDAALGPNYAPSAMRADSVVKLPIIVHNDLSGFTFDKCTSGADTDCYALGYRFFDAKGNVAIWSRTDLPADITSGSTSATIALRVDDAADARPVHPPARSRPPLHPVRRDDLGWAVDWAKPSAFYSRNKKVLRSDNTRWTGSASVERDEFGIAVGSGANAVNVQTVGTGDGGTLGIDLATRNLEYAGAGGVGFADRIPLGLTYGYDSRNAAADCAGTAYLGILGACGWYTNWDERLTDTSVAATRAPTRTRAARATATS